MTPHIKGTRDEWLKARLALLEDEKDLTKRMDALTRRRMALPWVRVEKDYRFDTEDGAVSLAELFGGRSQLVVYHFMFGPRYEAGCPSCSAIADGFDGTDVHLRNHDVAFWAISRAPLAKLLAYRERMGWRFPWASSHDSDFNFDFGVSFTPEQQRDGIRYNYTQEPPVPPDQISGANIPDPDADPSAQSGLESRTYARERPGMSAFAVEDGEIYHTYSAFSRGVDAIWSTYRWLDLAPLGRNEHDYWWRHHDRYPAA